MEQYKRVTLYHHYEEVITCAHSCTEYSFMRERGTTTTYPGTNKTPNGLGNRGAHP